MDVNIKKENVQKTSRPCLELALRPRPIRPSPPPLIFPSWQNVDWNKISNLQHTYETVPVEQDYVCAYSEQLDKLNHPLVLPEMPLSPPQSPVSPVYRLVKMSGVNGQVFVQERAKTHSRLIQVFQEYTIIPHPKDPTLPPFIVKTASKNNIGNPGSQYATITGRPMQKTNTVAIPSSQYAAITGRPINNVANPSSQYAAITGRPINNVANPSSQYAAITGRPINNVANPSSQYAAITVRPTNNVTIPSSRFAAITGGGIVNPRPKTMAQSVRTQILNFAPSTPPPEQQSLRKQTFPVRQPSNNTLKRQTPIPLSAATTDPDPKRLRTGQELKNLMQDPNIMQDFSNMTLEAISKGCDLTELLELLSAYLPKEGISDMKD